MVQNSSDISIIASRVQSLESRLEDNIDKINGRLDLIVELMRQVTVLQEREISNASQITDIKTAVKETNTTLKEWNTHVHQRMDSHLNDMKIYKMDIEEAINTFQHDIKKDIDKNTEISNSTQKEFAKWLNRGIGAWAIGSVLIIVIQFVGGYAINGVLDRQEKLELRLIQDEVIIRENEKKIYKIMSDPLSK